MKQHCQLIDGIAVMVSMSFEKSSTIYRRGIAYEDRRAALFNGVASFFTRLGGCSLPPADSLNFSNGPGEDEENIRRNIRIASDSLGIDPGAIVMCEQRHSDAIVSLSSPPSSMPIADAVIAERAGIFPAIRTADCLPILIMDPVTRVSAAIHAGWRGTAQRVAPKVVQAMVRQYKVMPKNVLAALGPTIGVCCYEVGNDVISRVLRNIPNAEKYIVAKGTGKAEGTPSSYFVNLVEINRSELIRCGVPEANIKGAEICTSCRGDLFFSYRRDRGKTGRQISIVGFRP